LKTAPHSQTVSIFSGGVASPLVNHAADRLIGMQLRRDRGDAIRLDVNRVIKSMFLLGEYQNDGLVMRMEPVANNAINRPTHNALRSAFQFGFENGAIARPMISHATTY